jgi:hypothetical protein
MESSQQPAGWYDDPEDGTQLRYWNGSQWTDDRSPKAGAAPAAAAQPAAAQPAQDYPGSVPAAGASAGTNGKATASLVLGLVALLIWPSAILGLIFGFIARKEIAENPGQQGSGMATAGIVCSLVFGILGALWMINVLANS